MRTVVICSKWYYAYCGNKRIYPTCFEMDGADVKIERNIYKKLLEWKNSCQGTKALLIGGASRISKSTVAEELISINIKKLREDEQLHCMLDDIS